jgi:hypothetical protein
MTNQPYVNPLPVGTNNPSFDRPNMTINNNSIEMVLEQDHHAFADQLGGYHLIVHQDPNPLGTGNISFNQVAPRLPSTPIPPIPTPIPINQLMALLVTPNSTSTSTDTQLFNQTANGGWSQLTGALTGNSNSDGWVWAGGILLQWGVVSQSFSAGSTTGNVVFKDRVPGAVPFPNNCFVVLTTGFYSGSANGAGTATIRFSQTSATGFQWTFNTNSTAYTGFYWFAVGQ